MRTFASQRLPARLAPPPPFAVPLKPPPLFVPKKEIEDEPSPRDVSMGDEPGMIEDGEADQEEEMEECGGSRIAVKFVFPPISDVGVSSGQSGEGNSDAEGDAGGMKDVLAEKRRKVVEYRSRLNSILDFVRSFNGQLEKLSTMTEDSAVDQCPENQRLFEEVTCMLTIAFSHSACLGLEMQKDLGRPCLPVKSEGSTSSASMFEWAPAHSSEAEGDMVFVKEEDSTIAEHRSGMSFDVPDVRIPSACTPTKPSLPSIRSASLGSTAVPPYLHDESGGARLSSQDSGLRSWGNATGCVSGDAMLQYASSSSSSSATAASLNLPPAPTPSFETEASGWGSDASNGSSYPSPNETPLYALDYFPPCPPNPPPPPPPETLRELGLTV